MATSDPGSDAEELCPYKGLFPFSAEDEKYFFGRTSDAELLAANILTARVLVLHGPSGVGKSSLLGAALPRALEDIAGRLLILSFARWDRGFYSKLLGDVRTARLAAFHTWGAALCRERRSAAERAVEYASGQAQPETLELAERRRSRNQAWLAMPNRKRSLESMAKTWTQCCRNARRLHLRSVRAVLQRAGVRRQCRGSRVRSRPRWHHQAARPRNSRINQHSRRRVA